MTALLSPLLTLADIKVERAGALTLDIPAMTLGAGESLLLTGPSGSGKTTLLHVICGLLRPTSGDVIFKGESCGSMTEAARDALRRRHFGFVFQQLHLIGHLSVADNIRLAAPSAPVAELLAQLGIADLAKKPASALSHGQAQRAGIARALANNPDIILADEPTSALDDANARAVIDLLHAQAQKTGAALIVASHDARVMDGFSRTLKLEQGKIAS